VGKFLSKYIHPYTYRFKSNWTYQFTWFLPRREGVRHRRGGRILQNL
jgi:hypothetical protein